MADFIYQEPFPVGEDKTEYRLLTKDYVKVVECDGRKILKVDPAGLELLSKAAYCDVSFCLRAAHLQKLRNILEDPEATDNDKFVAYTMLLNQVVAAEGELPTCQDTGTAICIGHKGEDVYTGADDAACIAKGVYETYKDRNLRYSQVVPFTMTDEKNSGTNLPAQIDIYGGRPGMEYEFLFITKGGGSANKTFLYQQTKALLNEESLTKFIKQHIFDLGTSACPPYHLAIVHRRHVGRNVPLDREEGLGRLPRRTAHVGQRGRPLLPRPGMGGEGAQDLSGERRRRAVRRQVPRARRARDPRAAPCGFVPRGHRRELLGRPQHQGQDHARRHLPRSSWRRIPPASCPKHAPAMSPAVDIDLDEGMDKVREILYQISDQDAPEPEGHADRGARHRPRPHQADARRGQADARILQEAPGVLRRSGQDAGGHGFGLVRPHDGRPHGPLRGSVPVARRFAGDGGQGQPLAGRSPTPAGSTAVSTSVRSAARRLFWPSNSIKSVEVVDFPELGMEAVRKIYVEDFPAFIIVDDKGNDFFADFKH